MGRDYTDALIAETLEALRDWVSFQDVAVATGLSRKTIYRVKDGEDFKPSTRLGLVTLFEEVGLEADHDDVDVRGAARKIEAIAQAVDLADEGEDLLDQEGDEEQNGTR